MALYSNPAAKTWLASNAPQTSSWLMEFWWIFIALSAIYPTIILTFAKAVARRAESNGLSVDGLLALLASLDAIVGCKVKRFAKQAASGDPISKEDAFCTITQPDIQIAEIVREVCSLFNATRMGSKKPLIRVTLAVMKDGKITDLPIYYPAEEPVRASIKQLNNPNSAILCAAKGKKIIVIEDIQKELQRARKRRFVDAGNEEDNSGSLICYPIISHNNQIVSFVISLHCDEEGYFRNRFQELYEHSLKRFALRLNLECSLLHIKEKICG